MENIQGRFDVMLYVHERTQSLIRDIEAVSVSRDEKFDAYSAAFATIAGKLTEVWFNGEIPEGAEYMTPVNLLMEMQKRGTRNDKAQ